MIVKFYTELFLFWHLATLNLHIFEFSQFRPDLIAPINLGSRRTSLWSPQVSAALLNRLTRWGLATPLFLDHMVSQNLITIGADNGFLPVCCQTIIWTNADLSTGPIVGEGPWNMNQNMEVFFQ